MHLVEFRNLLIPFDVLHTILTNIHVIRNIPSYLQVHKLFVGVISWLFNSQIFFYCEPGGHLKFFVIVLYLTSLMSFCYFCCCPRLIWSHTLTQKDLIVLKQLHLTLLLQVILFVEEFFIAIIVACFFSPFWTNFCLG